PQYAPTVVGRLLAYDPSGDCDGHFTSSKFQVNNNCYNYACDIATNSYAQPGRIHEFFLEKEGGPTGSVIGRGAQLDGLLSIGGADTSLEYLAKFASEHQPGHIVALLISPPENSVRWRGDYHWVRCDSLERTFWSQKDGSDQVTDFDF